jgi:hypothetical protein
MHYLEMEKLRAMYQKALEEKLIEQEVRLRREFSSQIHMEFSIGEAPVNGNRKRHANVYKSKVAKRRRTYM